MKNFGYKVFERNFRSRFEPTIKALQLQCSPLCLPAPEIGEEAKETEEASGHPEVVMKDVSAHLDKGKQVVSEDQQQAQDSVLEQQIVVFENQNAARTSSRIIPEEILKTLVEMKEESALVRQRLDGQDIMFEMILSILPPLPPPQNPNP